MGLDFITRCTPGFQRSWDRGRQDIVQHDLFTRHPELRDRTFRLSPTNGTDFQPGEELVFRFHEGELVAFRGRALVGVFTNTTPALVEGVQQAPQGVACGRVDKVHAHSRAADVILLS
jgi:hypothetical protein